MSRRFALVSKRADAAVLHLLLDVSASSARRSSPGAAGDKARGLLWRHIRWPRPTLNAVGLQHEDGHSHLLAGSIPLNCRAFTIRRAFVRGRCDLRRTPAPHAAGTGGRNSFAITVMNENYAHPDMPAGVRPTSSRACKFVQGRRQSRRRTRHAQLLGCGTILREAIAARRNCSRKEFGVTSDIRSCPKATELRRDGFDVEAGTACIRWTRSCARRTSPLSSF